MTAKTTNRHIKIVNKAKQKIKELLEDPNCVWRTMRILKGHTTGLSEQEILDILSNLGATSSVGEKGEKIWKLHSRGDNDTHKQKKQSRNKIISHSDYWKNIWSQCSKIKFRYVIISMLLVSAYLGYIKFSPEVSTPLGKFAFNTSESNKVLSSSVLSADINPKKWTFLFLGWSQVLITVNPYSMFKRNGKDTKD
ncbi:MAG: hypothetical protein NTZ13_01555 [Candidatus Parcubacteria bacterium]|nr:hypothetical protein [Candidatus Parcubacteria bacterium]